ncbi:beta-lactamase/transpeptidase-like protein [Hysterangium stoloniferum]|nr:beta-lactamase/transpeptidase-like protein [Hysterangium stoloniferum]
MLLGLVALCCSGILVLQNSLFVLASGRGLQQPLPKEEEIGGTESLLDDEFSTWIEETGRSWGMKGIAIAIVRKNSTAEETSWTVETKGYGIANRFGDLVDEESLFSLGSNSKLFTALAMGTVISDASKNLSWNSKVNDILPSSVWGLQDKYAEARTNIVDILSHRTGLPRHDLSPSRGDSIAKIRHLRPATEFRETAQYNNHMYVVASHIISKMTGMPFVSYVYRNIIVPIGLSSTTYNTCWAEESGKLVDGFINAGFHESKGTGFRHLRFLPVPYWNVKGGRELNAGAGGIISNAKDVAIWLQTLLTSGRSPVTGNSVIPSSVVHRVSQGVSMLSPGSMFPELSTKIYGMGQEMYSYQGVELIEHSGSTIGQHSILTRAPNQKIGIAVLTNWDDGAYFQEIVKFKLLEKALRLKSVDWNERYREISNQVERNMQQRKAQRPANPLPPTTSVKELEGLYYNPAYGKIGLCAFPPRNKIRTWSSHLIIQHLSGDNFTASPPYVFPAPFPNDTQRDADEITPFAIKFGGTDWQVQFLFNEGAEASPTAAIGMAWKGMWGAGRGVSSPSGGGRDGAEVWFDKIV